jgi:predicted TIM-barrel fold metal-dependent hydrolase
MAPRIDLSEAPIADNHMHVFLPEASDPEFDPLATFTLGGDDPKFLETAGRALSPAERSRLARNVEHTVAYQHALRALADLFQCEAIRDEVLRARRERAADFAAYVRSLYADMRLEAVLVDMGNPPAADLPGFGALTGTQVYGIYRIEPAIGELWDDDEEFEGFEGALLERMSSAVAREHVVAFKTVIAYRTGLAVNQSSRAEAVAAFDQLKRSPDSQGLLRRVKVSEQDWQAAKTLREYLLWRALLLSVELSVPFQVHTGLGDQDLDINVANPALLTTVLRDPKLRHARIVLLHGSYPFYEEAACLAQVFPNVYLDLSLFHPFLGAGAARVARAIIDLAPFTKLLYGSDAYNSPEMHWVAIRDGRAMVARILDDLVSERDLTNSMAVTVAGLILSENAREVYGLDSD